MMKAPDYFKIMGTQQKETHLSWKDA